MSQIGSFRVRRGFFFGRPVLQVCVRDGTMFDMDGNSCPGERWRDASMDDFEKPILVLADREEPA